MVPRRPRLLITGCSGFLGSRLLAALHRDYVIEGIARRSPASSGVPRYPSVLWHQVDIADREAVTELFRAIRTRGPIDAVLHLAAYYEFRGESPEEYWRTNVHGLRNVLDACRDLGPGLFVFTSSVAASDFPAPGSVLDETSPPDGDHVYSVTKAEGERMLAEYRDAFPSVIVRLAALYSDWCEYLPLFHFLETWCEREGPWRVLGGRGDFAIPYLHVRDAVRFFRRGLHLTDLVRPSPTDEVPVLVCSGDGATSTRELFEEVTRWQSGDAERPVVLPKLLCALGIHLRFRLASWLGQEPFERPWMARHIDRRMTVDARKTRELLGWSPRERMDLLRRIPFLLENRSARPQRWYRRNEIHRHLVRPSTHLRVARVLENRQDAIARRIADRLREEGLRGYSGPGPAASLWNHRTALRQWWTAIRTEEPGVFRAYCRDLAEMRFEQGFDVEDVCRALAVVHDACLEVLRDDPEAPDLDWRHLHRLRSVLRFGCDQVQETWEVLSGADEAVPDQEVAVSGRSPG